MGMTIAEPIQTLEYLRDSGVFPFQYKGVLYTVESIDEAIDSMRKYQKIQEILNSASYIENDTVYSYTYDEDSRVKRIREVVEDGRT